MEIEDPSGVFPTIILSPGETFPQSLTVPFWRVVITVSGAWWAHADDMRSEVPIAKTRSGRMSLQARLSSAPLSYSPHIVTASQVSADGGGSAETKHVSMPRRPQDPVMLQQFGARLRAAREAGGFTQQRLADLVRVRASTVSLYEAGGLSPTLTMALELARALGVPLARLVDFDVDIGTPTPADAEEAEVVRRLRELSPDNRALVSKLLRALAPAAGADRPAE